MPSSAISPVTRAQNTDGGKSSATPVPESYPVPPEWLITDPAENKRRILEMLAQGERDIAANRGHDLDEVLAELDAT